MIVAVFSDVHANLPALEAFLAAVDGVADRYLCLGDIVNYGPWNDECLVRIMGLPYIEVVAGNHDRLFLSGLGLAEEAPLVQEFFHASHANFTRVDLLRDLPNSIDLGPFRCQHTLRSERIFVDTEIEIDSDYLIGHSHWQYSTRRGPWRLINPGSVGQNRERIDTVDYATYDTTADIVSLHRIPYDIFELLAELRSRRWPDACVEYYERKLRDVHGTT